MKLSILLTDNNRSKAYLQNLIFNNFVPSEAIYLDPENIQILENVSNQNLTKHLKNTIQKVSELETQYDESEPVLTTLKKHSVPTKIVKNLDINSTEVIEQVKRCPTEYIIYSGPSGSILRKEILSQNKKFIHMHPGWLPEHRGSTTLYYSLLFAKNLSCSAFVMNEEIDGGEILYRLTWKPSNLTRNIDQVADPCFRAATLIKLLNENPNLESLGIKEKKFYTFYTIHPFLKHLAILKSTSEEVEAKAQ